MTEPRAVGRRGALAVLLAAGVALVTVAGTGSAPARTAAPAPALRSGRPAAPATLDIPAIGVHTALLRLGLEADGSVSVPPLESAQAGWYEHSPVPGAPGPAVLLGHVDSARSGPSVFFRLKDLRPGDPISVTRTDGTVVAFRVGRVARYPKAAFPTAEVYGDLDHAGLRLITCGGAFDGAARSYLDNVVVFATGVAR